MNSTAPASQAPVKQRQSCWPAGKHLFSRETSPPCGCVTPARKCATIFPLRGRIRSCKPCWKGSFRGRRNISVSTPMPTPLMKIRTTAAGMRTKPFSRRGLGRGSMKRILCATRFGSHGLIGKQQAAHRCSRRNGERPPTKFSTHCAQSRATVSNRLTDSSGHGQLNRAMRGKRCKTTALARP